MKSKLPTGWQEIELGDVTSIDSGQGAPQGEKYFNGKEEVFVRAGDLNNLTDRIYVGDYCEKINDEAVKEYKLKKYKKDSIVFPKSGMSIQTGNIAILKYDSYVVNHLAIVEPSEKITSKFLYYLLDKIGISHLSKDDSYPSIRISDVKTMKILLPAPPVQKKIVSILEKAENLKQKREEADKLTNEYLKSVFYEMFYNKGFEEVELGEVCEINPKKSELENTDKYLEVSFVPMAIVREHEISFIPEETKKLDEVYTGYTYFKNGDVLLAKVTPCFENGKSGIAKNLKNGIGFGSSEYHVIRPSPKLLAELIYFIISDNSFLISGKKQMSGTGGLKRLPKDYIYHKIVPLSPLPLQQKFAKIVEKVEKLKEKQKDSREKINEMFDALMQKAFRGEL